MTWEDDFLEGIFSRSKTIFPHKDFRGLWEYTLEQEGLGDDPAEFGDGEYRYLCDDLGLILSKMEGKKASACKEIFKREKRHFPVIQVERPPSQYVWFNTTIAGINIRPGKMSGTTKLPAPVIMGGDKPHGVIVGRTGSGKSVLLHNIIMNLLLEYAPWELALYLADFKLVELSKYMNREGCEAPHVRACAATGEVEYVLSLIQHIKEKNDEREQLFKYMGYSNIEEFRRDPGNKDIIMPRVLFLVDEFQQLFLDSNGKQRNNIDDMITHLTRKGRSQGIHLLFASQDMSGALTQKQLSNFKIRIALPCEDSVSIDILGNRAAADIVVGQVVVNTESKFEKDNRLFTVPFVAGDDAQGDEESYFYEVLQSLADYATSYGFRYRENQKFYQEHEQNLLESLRRFLEKKSVKRLRRDIHSSAFAAIVYGRKTVHSNQIFDIENYYIEYGKNRNLLCVSGLNEDLAYMQKLLLTNFNSLCANNPDLYYTDGNWKFRHELYYDFNPVVSSLFPEDEKILELGLSKQDICFKAEDLEIANELLQERKQTLSILRSGEYRNAKDYLMLLWDYYRRIGNQIPDDRALEIRDSLRNRLCPSLDENDSNLLEYIKEVDLYQEEYNFLFEPYEVECFLTMYNRFKHLDENGFPSSRIFDAAVIWFSGIDNIEKLPRWFSEFAAYCMDYNLYCLFFANSIVDYEVSACCTYMIVGGQDVALYEKYYGEAVHKRDGSISLHCFIKNRNNRFGFKKNTSMSLKRILSIISTLILL